MEIMSWINESWHAALHCTAFVFLEAMNDETPVIGATSWPALLYMMQPAGGRPAPQESNRRPGAENVTDLSTETQNTVTLYRLMNWILLKTHTHTRLTHTLTHN